MTRTIHKRLDSSPVPDSLTAVVRTAAVVFGLSLATAVLFWTAFIVAFTGIDHLWLAPLAVVVVSAVPFAAGAIVYAVILDLLDRNEIQHRNHPAVIASLVFCSLGLGSFAVGILLSWDGLLPVSGPGAFTGLLVAIGAAILAHNGYMHHDSD